MLDHLGKQPDPLQGKLYQLLKYHMRLDDPVLLLQPESNKVYSRNALSQLLSTQSQLSPQNQVFSSISAVGETVGFISVSDDI